MTDKHARAEQIAALIDDDAIPIDDGGPVFDAPWQARAFGIAVALHERTEYDWAEFQRRLVDAIAAVDQATLQDNTDSQYYEQFLSCVEAKLLEDDVMTAAELEQRTAEFESGERDAAEFVVTDPLPDELSTER